VSSSAGWQSEVNASLNALQLECLGGIGREERDELPVSLETIPTGETVVGSQAVPIALQHARTVARVGRQYAREPVVARKTE
jgi:hypothetical protein